MDQTKEIDIDLRKIFYMMRTKIIFIILITFFTGILAGCYTHFFIEPTYTASVKFCVYSNTDRIATTSSITQNEIAASQELVNTYVYVLKSNTVLEKISKDLGLGLEAGTIYKMVSTSLVEDTQAFQVTVKSNDPNLSAKIANSIAKNAPEEITKIVMAGGIKVIDYATVPQQPSAPNTKKNIMVGALAGFFLSFICFFIYEMFDSTITNAKDIERDFEIPVLGTIPKLDTIDKADDTVLDAKIEAKTPAPPVANINKPSDTLLENIQAMKGDGKND